MDKKSKIDKISFMIGAALMTAIIFPFRPKAAITAWKKVKKQWQ
jgi:hypothetical protein